MKSCPTCQRTFEDTLTYCLVDGSILSAPFDPQATQALPQQNPTVPMMNPAATNPATAPPATVPAVKSNKLLWVTLASVALIVAGTILAVALINRQSNSSESVSNVAEQNKTQVNETNVSNHNDNSQPASKTVTENKNTANENTANANAQSGDETGTEDLRRLHQYSGQYANDMFKNEAGLRERVKSLLGQNYKLFMERWDVTSPIEDDGKILFAEGCMAHACGAEESLLAIDTSRGIISCAVLSDSLGGKFKTYSEGNSSLPPVMKNKIQELMSMK